MTVTVTGTATRQGWQCPACLRCFSPDISECRYCQPTVYAVHRTDNTPGNYDNDSCCLAGCTVCKK